MNLTQATRYPFADRSWPRKLGLVLLISPVPVFGQLFALGYAVETLRGLMSRDHDGTLPEAKFGWELCWLGAQAMLLTFVCGLAVAFLGAPLLIGQEVELEPLTPAMVQALGGPSLALLAVVSAVVYAPVLARFVLTGKFLSALDPVAAWRLLRAEPAIWVTAAVVGYVVVEGPYALAWVLPLKGGWHTGASVITCTVLWTFGQMINAHLIADAVGWSTRSASARTAEVRYRW